MDDLTIISMILALAVLPQGIRFLARRGKALYDSGQGSTLEIPTYARDLSSEKLAGTAVASKQEITVTFSDSGKQYRWIETNDSLLEFAESRGIEVESLCRAGECGSCRTRLIEGEVEYHEKPGINPGRGHCLLCISKPKSNLVLKR